MNPTVTPFASSLAGCATRRFLGVIVAASALAAQGALSVPPFDFRVPVHTTDVDGSSETWTSGPNYKASFHDGFVFYPVLGKASPHNLPWRWTTVEVRAGSATVLSTMPAASPHATPSRVTYAHVGVREIYDVRDDGVEQSFVIEERPSAGDLVIRGRVATDLRCAATARGHHALTFYAGEQPIVRYGEAFAFDAAGRRTEWPRRSTAMRSR